MWSRLWKNYRSRIEPTLSQPQATRGFSLTGDRIDCVAGHFGQSFQQVRQLVRSFAISPDLPGCRGGELCWLHYEARSARGLPSQETHYGLPPLARNNEKDHGRSRDVLCP